MKEDANSNNNNILEWASERKKCTNKLISYELCGVR